MLKIAPPSLVAKKALFREEIKRLAISYHRFDRTFICADCNSADKDLKKAVGAHKHFSYSPAEIGQFLTRDSSGNRIIQENVAVQIYENAKTEFEKRLTELRSKIESEMMKYL